MQKQIPETKNASVKLVCTNKMLSFLHIFYLHIPGTLISLNTIGVQYTYVIVIVKFQLLHTNAGNIHARMLRPIVDLLLHKVHLLLAAAPCPARGRTKTNSNYDHDEKDDSDDNGNGDGGGGEGQRIRILYISNLAMLDCR